MRFTSALGLAMAAFTSAAPAPEPEPQAHVWKVSEPFKEGDGSPVQVYLYKQISSNQQCGDDDGTASCTVNHMQSESFTIGWGASISGAGWISADFSVSKSTTTGNSHMCNNLIDNEWLADYICIWKRVAHTEYTVKDWEKYNYQGDDDWVESSDAYQMWSPNSGDMGHEYVCAWDDDCWNKGAEWWGPSREPGGPTHYPFDDKWQ